MTLAWIPLIALFACSPSHSADKIEAQIRKDIPLGSSSQAVLAYLSGKSIEHSWVGAEKKIRAIVRNTATTLAVTENLSIEFEFDRDLKLVDITFKKVYKGP
jgi:hypothetical protein